MKVALLALLAAVAASPAFAADDWNGTWIGKWDKASDSAQIIVVGSTAVGFFWRGAYVSDELHSSVNGSTLSITWGPSKSNESTAILTRESAETAHVVLHEPGRGFVEFSVRLDR